MTNMSYAEQFKEECKKYTREQFLSHVYSQYPGDESPDASLRNFGVSNLSLGCPSAVGLSDSECDCSCFDCWRTSTKDVVFADTPREPCIMKDFMISTTSCYKEGKTLNIDIDDSEGLISVKHDTGMIIVPKNELEFIEVKEEK